MLAAVALVAVPACGSSGASPASSGSSATATTAAGVRTLEPKEAAATLGAGRVVLDIRTADEFAQGHLAGAKDLDFYQPTFAASLGELDKSTPYLVYCHSGNRSGKARAMMEQLGFQDVVEVAGGITAWTAAGLPTER